MTNQTEVLVEILDIPNRNGRIYPKTEIEKSLKAFKEKLPVVGQLGYSDDPSTYTEINLSRVSHVVNDVRIEDDKLIATVKILTTPSGRIAEQLIRSEETRPSLGFGMRGTGIVDTNNKVTDFNLISIDLVNNPISGYQIPNDLFSETSNKN